MAKLLQWNVRGLQANREELTLLLSSVNQPSLPSRKQISEKVTISTFEITISITHLVLKIMASIAVVELS